MIGKNDITQGGNKKCFHCNTCGFVECDYLEDMVKENLKRIKDRLKKFK